jgi:hypothetical protein
MTPGLYRHFKGNFYVVLGMVKHSETEEELVLYRPRDGHQLWVRPVAMWNEFVQRADYSGPRFTLVAEDGNKEHPAD